jgi:hypothetical protein
VIDGISNAACLSDRKCAELAEVKVVVVLPKEGSSLVLLETCPCMLHNENVQDVAATRKQERPLFYALGSRVCQSLTYGGKRHIPLTETHDTMLFFVR